MCRSGLASTDILVLVISAEDGIWPQTLKIIDSFQGKKDVMSLIVAVTKIDKVQDRVEDAHQKIEWELMEHQIFPEQIQMVPLSAKTREGLTDMMEAIQMQAELIELKSSVSPKEDKFMEGIILEGRMEKGLGAVVDIVVRDGNPGLCVGDTVLCTDSNVYGRVRAIQDGEEKQ